MFTGAIHKKQRKMWQPNSGITQRIAAFYRLNIFKIILVIAEKLPNIARTDENEKALASRCSLLKTVTLVAKEYFVGKEGHRKILFFSISYHKSRFQHY